MKPTHHTSTPAAVMKEPILGFDKSQVEALSLPPNSARSIGGIQEARCAGWSAERGSVIVNVTRGDVFGGTSGGSMLVATQEGARVRDCTKSPASARMGCDTKPFLMLPVP